MTPSLIKEADITSVLPSICILAPEESGYATIEGVTYNYFYTSADGADYLLEYYLETNSVLGKSQGLNRASP